MMYLLNFLHAEIGNVFYLLKYLQQSTIGHGFLQHEFNQIHRLPSRILAFMTLHSKMR